MPVTIGFLTETTDGEARVAATPETTKKWIAQGARVVMQIGAGVQAGYTDEQYLERGVEITDDRAAVITQAQWLIGVHIPDDETLRACAPGTVITGLADLFHRPHVAQLAADQGLTLLAMERVPRISRAQSMDALSSQANLAGYRAVIEAAGFYARAMPMMMTAAGTIAPAKVFVMGAGVAGLQAIATARRLGAAVAATDVRLAAKEQVLSLGAKFVMVEDEETKAAETSGGYAREMSPVYQAKQATLIAETIAKQDIVITTAQIPGRAAPRLVTTAMIQSMRPGSVIVDLAVDLGGNVEGSVVGETVIISGVTIVGYRHLPARIATDASALYARNVFALSALVVATDGSGLSLKIEDEIIRGMMIAHNHQNLLSGK